jgi:hypothetical protein
MRPWLACIPLFAAVATAQREIPPDSVERLIDVWHLPQLLPGVTCKQFASTDPSGHGEDHGHYLRREGDRCVLAEMEGPGVIARLWSANPAGQLRVFCDGENEPRLDAPFADVFADKVAPFVSPIATRKSGGSISYFPIPYQKSCRVEVVGQPDPAQLYYHVQYVTYPAGTALRTFTRELPADERAALQRVTERWSAPGDSPVAPAPGDRDEHAQMKLESGAEQPLFTLDGAGTVLTLRLLPQPAAPDTLRGLLLCAAWDGGKPSLQVPVADLFACGFGPTPFAALLLGWDERGGYLHLPMPFRKGARVLLRNASGRTVDVAAQLRWRPGAPPAGFGALHAEFRSEDGVGKDLWEFAHIAGPGKFVGVTQTLQGVADLWYLEGNEEFTVDGERTPSIRGTGTEDIYNGGWYWNEGPFALPLHGIGVKEEWTTNRTTPWRILLPDAVPFEKSLVARIEHGSQNGVRDASYSSVAFWYAAPAAVRAVADTELHAPRTWVVRPRGFTGAGELKWDATPAVEWSSWDRLTPLYRALDKPVLQQFPASHVEQDAPALDRRVAVFRPQGAGGPLTFRARVPVPYADRWRVQLRLFATHELPLFAVDGREIELPDPRPPAPAPERPPLRTVEVALGALTAGEHRFEFTVPNARRSLAGLDALRLLPGSPFVHTWWIAPRVAADSKGTVEDRVPIEASLLDAKFDPAAAGWKPATTADVVPLGDLVSHEDQSLAYLLTFVHVPTACRVRALLGSDDGVRVWCNGELCWSHALHRPLVVDADSFDMPLRAGWNRLLVKVKNDDGGFGLSLRVSDADGSLRWALLPQ